MLNAFLSKIQKQNWKKYFLFITFSLFVFYSKVIAIDLDTSIDDEIRRSYNPSKLEEDMALPVLPKVLTEMPPKQTSLSENKTYINPKPSGFSNVNTIKANAIKGSPIESKQITDQYKEYVAIKSGTKIKVKLLNAVSDHAKSGTRISFISKYPVSSTYFTIPMGTIFSGKVIDSHKPQFSANGGLLVINIDSVKLKDGFYPISARVTKANSKHIYFNNIKGKRKYISNMFKSMKPGRTFGKKMFNAGMYLAQDGATFILTPFAFVIGAAGFAGNVAVSPVFAFFSKGDSIYFKEGTDFVIKFNEPLFLVK